MKTFLVITFLLAAHINASSSFSTQQALRHSPTVKHENGGVSIKINRQNNIYEQDHRLGDSNSQATKSLKNYHDFSYYGTMYVGTPPQEVTLIFDTGSDWMTVESASCGNCHGINFDSDSSETFKLVGDSASLREYGSATLKGIEVKDKVCLLKDKVTNKG